MELEVSNKKIEYGYIYIIQIMGLRILHDMAKNFIAIIAFKACHRTN